MKIFLSWSGEISHGVAKALRDWLPSVIQAIDPYVSSEDIEKGARWASDIAGELDTSSYGIICLTPDNISAPWINFEAGALGKRIDSSRVSPVLFRLKRAEVQGPLVQFQSTMFEHDDMWKLMHSINNALGDNALDEARLRTSFQKWWPTLQELLNAIPKAEEPLPPEAPQSKASAEMTAILEELLDLTRANTKVLGATRGLVSQEVQDEILQLRDLVSRKESIIDRCISQLQAIKRMISPYLDELAATTIGNDLVSQLDSISTGLIFGQSNSYFATTFLSSIPKGASLGSLSSVVAHSISPSRHETQKPPPPGRPVPPAPKKPSSPQSKAPKKPDAN